MKSPAPSAISVSPAPPPTSVAAPGWLLLASMLPPPVPAENRPVPSVTASMPLPPNSVTAPPPRSTSRRSGAGAP